jgi:hypothetical protein
MPRQNTAAEKLVEQILKNINEKQKKLMEDIDDNQDSNASKHYITGKDVGMGEAKYETIRAFEQVTGQEFER